MPRPEPIMSLAYLKNKASWCDRSVLMGTVVDTGNGKFMYDHDDVLRFSRNLERILITGENIARFRAEE